MKKILLIEDDPALNKNIQEALQAGQLEVATVFDGLQAEKLLQQQEFDCLILDINLPGKGGFDLCRDFRRRNTATPVLMLTAFSELDDKVKGFECGADDYLTKPFYMRELVLRVNALLKRSENNSHSPEDSQQLCTADMVISLASKKVSRQGTEIALTPREYQVLIRLIEAKGELVSKRELMREIWGSSFDVNSNTVEVYINFLRNKVDKPFGKASIKTKVGYGYYFDEE